MTGLVGKPGQGGEQHELHVCQLELGFDLGQGDRPYVQVGDPAPERLECALVGLSDHVVDDLPEGGELAQRLPIAESLEGRVVVVAPDVRPPFPDSSLSLGLIMVGP